MALRRFLRIPRKQKAPSELENETADDWAAAAAAVPLVVDVVVFDCQNSNLFATDDLSPDLKSAATVS